MAKDNLKDIMAARSSTPPRDVVTPINPLAIAAQASQLAEKSGSQEAEKLTSPEVRMPAIQEVNESAGQESVAPKKSTSREAGKPTSGRVKKFGTYLREDSIKQLRMIAMQEDREVKEIIQNLVDQFIKSRQK
jgi:hypothetical protein